MTVDENAVQDLYVWHTDVHSYDSPTPIDATSPDCSLAIHSSHDCLDGSHLVPVADDNSPPDLDNYQGPGRIGKAQNENVRTFVHGRKQQALEDNTVYQIFEMHNQGHHPGYKTATSLEKVDTSYGDLSVEQHPPK